MQAVRYILGGLILLWAVQPAWAISEKELNDLDEGTVVEIPDPEKVGDTIDLKVDQINVFEVNGDKVYELEGADEDGEVQVFMNFSGDTAEASVVDSKLTISDIGVKGFKKFEKDDARGKGKITYEGEDYLLSEWSDGSYIPDGDASKKEPVSYFVYENKADEDESIIVIIDDDDQMEIVFVNTVDGAAVEER